MDVRITFRGTTALIMHNEQLANPLNPTVKAMKAITDKRQMTDDDLIEKFRLEHFGSLYVDPDVGPYIPGRNIERCLVDSARVTRAGKKIERGVFVSTDVNPLQYRGPRDPAGLWADENFRNIVSVRVQQSRVQRCRPIFAHWSTEADVTLDTALLSLEELGTIVESAGAMIGLCDHRPRYGRFTAVVDKL